MNYNSLVQILFQNYLSYRTLSHSNSTFSSPRITGTSYIMGSPYIIGIAGGVGVGKSSFAYQLKMALLRQSLLVDSKQSSPGLQAQDIAIVSTDHFLKSSSQLRLVQCYRGSRKSYQREQLATFLEQVCSGKSAYIPYYSHQKYQIHADAFQYLSANKILIVEGINALSEPIIVKRLQYRIYLLAGQATVLKMLCQRLSATFNQYSPKLPEYVINSLVRDLWYRINRYYLSDYWPSLNAMPNVWGIITSTEKECFLINFDRVFQLILFISVCLIGWLFWVGLKIF